MRLVGFLVLLAGLGLAFGLPLYQADFSGEQTARERIFDRKADGWNPRFDAAMFELKEEQSPVRIRLEGERAAGDSYLGTSIPVTIDIQGPEGKVLSAAMDMSLSAHQRESAQTNQHLFVSTPDFDVISSGQHTVRVTAQLDRDVSILWMEAIVVANTGRQSDEYLQPGLILAGMGGVLIILGNALARRRKRKKKAKPARWGRG